MPRIKGIDLLQEGIYAVDLEKTIEDMFLIIRNMETQLERVLNINTLLEKDLNYTKETVTEFKAENTQLHDTIARMEEEMPSKRELQIEINHLMDERNNAEERIRKLKQQNEKLAKTMTRSQGQAGKLEEKRREAIKEISYFESRLNDSSEKISECERVIKYLRGEVLAKREKVGSLEQELKEELDEKYRALKALKDSQQAVAEFRSALADKKLQSEKGLL